MLWEYTVQITEKRADEKIYFVYNKTFSKKDAAYRAAGSIIDRMTAIPNSVTIYKCIVGGHSVPTTPFEWGYPAFHDTDFCY